MSYRLSDPVPIVDGVAMFQIPRSGAVVGYVMLDGSYGHVGESHWSVPQPVARNDTFVLRVERDDGGLMYYYYDTIEYVRLKIDHDERVRPKFQVD